MPNLCMVAQNDALEHSVLAGYETEEYVHTMAEHVCGKYG